MGVGCKGMEFRVEGLGLRVQDLGFGVEGSGFGVWGLGFGVWDLYGYSLRGGPTEGDRTRVPHLQEEAPP